MDDQQQQQQGRVFTAFSMHTFLHIWLIKCNHDWLGKNHKKLKVKLRFSGFALIQMVYRCFRLVGKRLGNGHIRTQDVYLI